jgi:hypothetical protein
VRTHPEFICPAAWACARVTLCSRHVWPRPPLLRCERNQARLLDPAASAHAQLPANLERLSPLALTRPGYSRRICRSCGPAVNEMSVADGGAHSPGWQSQSARPRACLQAAALTRWTATRRSARPCRHAAGFVALRNTQESARKMSVARKCSVPYRSREIGNCATDFVGAVLLDCGFRGKSPANPR